MASELELGAGVFVSSLPDYIGADEQSSYTLPFPYLYYRNDKVEIDRNAVTGFLWQQDNWYFELSASGSVPVRSDDNEARTGMVDIDFVGELGPALSYYFIGDPNADEQVSLAVNLRKAYATDFSYLDSIGYSYGASLHYDRKLSSFYQGQIQFNSSIKVDYANDDYLNFYYGVSEQYALVDRPFYQAGNGYRGTNINLGISWKSERFWFGSFVKYYNLSDTEQQHSPLVKSEHNWSIGLGLVGIFYKE